MAEEQNVGTPTPEQPKPEKPAPEPGSKASGDEFEQAKGTTWLSYLGLLWLIPMLTMKENEYAKWHVKQGIVLDIYTVGVAIVTGILSFILIGIVIGPIAFVIILVFRIIGIVKAVGGDYWKCPLGVYQLAMKFKF